MLKWMTGLLIGWCLVVSPGVYADTGAAGDTGSVEDTGSADEDTGSADTASPSTSSSGPTYGAAELAGESGSCATVAASPAGWVLGCALLVLVRRRLR